jgi:hypothetical protein
VIAADSITGSKAFFTVASIKSPSFGNTNTGHLSAAVYTLVLLPFRLLGSELEYIPERPSCLLCDALDVGELRFGTHASVRQLGDLHRH